MRELRSFTPVHDETNEDAWLRRRGRFGRECRDEMDVVGKRRVAYLRRLQDFAPAAGEEGDGNL